MTKINKLPQHVINLIAAGEVVERPASVLKELLENSIDANSSHIKVYIKNYGIDLIEVIDDGVGIDPEDIPLVFEQHATSKISKSSDLLKINSFGFRGEAMASIRSVAEKIFLQSKTRENDPIAVVVTPTSLIKHTAEGYQNGTRIQVYNLFSTVPARKKFLKSPSTEQKHIVQTFTHIALANPDIHFELYHNDKQIYNLVKSTLTERVSDILGRNFIKNSYFIDLETNLGYLNGFLGNTNLGKKYNPIQYIFLNNRYIVNKTISSAIQKSYSGFLHKDLKPQYVIFLKIDPKEVDVNVHPRKLEVRFENPPQIFKFVYNSVRKTLETESRKTLLENFATDSSIQAVERSNLQLLKSNVKNYNSNQSKYKTDYKNDYNYKSYSIQKALNFTHQILTSDDVSTENLSSYDLHDRSPKQIFNTYILVEELDSLIIIDQHAAHEKIIFEKLLQQNKVKNSKPLLIPIIVDISDDKMEQFEKAKNYLNEIGFKFENFGKNSIQIIEVPEKLNTIDVEEFFEELLNEEDDILEKNFQTYEFETKLSITENEFIILAKTACHGSIRAGQKLGIDEMNNLINDLFKLRYPQNCPHGRPTYYKLDKIEIDKFFKRII